MLITNSGANILFANLPLLCYYVVRLTYIFCGLAAMLGFAVIVHII